MRRLARLGLLLTGVLAAIGLSGCVKLLSETPQQLDTIGDVQLTSQICVTHSSDAACPDSDTNSGSDGDGHDAQLLVAYRIPDGAVAPATITATYVAGATGSTTLTQSASYASELQRLAPAPSGEHWVGYISPLILAGDTHADAKVEVVARFGLTRGPDGAPFGPSFHYFAVYGARKSDSGSAPPPQSDPARPVVCGSAFNSFNLSGDEGTQCVDSPKAADPATDNSVPASDLGVIGGAPPTVTAGTGTFVPFTIRSVNLDGGPVFTLTPSTNLPGASVSAAPTFTPHPGDAAVPVGLNVPAGTPPGAYTVTLAAQFGNQVRQATVTVNVTAVPRDTKAPLLKLKIAGKKHLANVLKHGLKVGVSCDEACKALVKITGSGKLASGKATLSRAGSRNVVAKFTSKARKKYAHANSLKLHIQVTATDLSGNKSVSKKTLKLKR